MVKNVIYQDSMSRCDFYSNPYQVNQQTHPALKKYRAESYAKTQDTLQSNHLENKYFLKFKNQVEMPNGAVKIAIQIGKYLFLGVIFPIYFAGYAIPKWLLLQAIPQFFSTIGKGLGHVKDHVADVAHRFVATLKHFGKTVTSPILIFIQTRIEKGKNIFSMIKDQTSQAAHFLAAPIRLFQRISGDIKAKLEEMGKKWQPFLKKMSKALAHLPTELISTGIKSIKNGLNKLHNSSIVHIAKAAFSSVTKSLSHFYAENQKGVQKVVDTVIYRPIARIKKSMDHLKEQVRRIAEPIQREIVQRLDAHLVQPFKKTMKSIERAMEKIRETGNDLRRKIEKRVDRIEKTIEKAATSVGNAIVQFLPTPVISLFLPLANLFSNNKDGKKGWRKSSFLKRWTEKAQRLKKGMKDRYQQMRRRLKETLARCKRGCRRVFSSSIVVTKKLLLSIKHLIIVLISALTATFLLIRLMLAWLRALLRYGMFLVRELAAHFLA